MVRCDLLCVSTVSAELCSKADMYWKQLCWIRIAIKDPSKTLGKALSTMIPFTKDKYSGSVKRGSFSNLTESHIETFKQLLGTGQVICDISELTKYNVDWFRTVRGESRLVLKPRTTQQVANVLRFCNQEKLAICPQGGNTCVTGGSVPVYNEIILSTELMNQVESVDPLSGVLVCQAGCILEQLDSVLDKYDLMMPLDLGAKGSCQIGGNVATNAGGIRLLRYGSLQSTVLGLEVVRADGTIINCLNTLKKDNTGYHLKNLFIGSEGSLGIITRVAISCPIRLQSRHLAFLGVNSFEETLSVVRQARHNLQEIVSAIELMDSEIIEAIKSNLGLTIPLGVHPFYMMIETTGSCEEHDKSKLHSFLENCLNDGIIANVIATSEPRKIRKLWEIRERAIEAHLKDGYVFCYDLSMPLNEFYSIVPVIRNRLGQKVTRVTGFGHMGDGNVHLNISLKEYSEKVHCLLEPYVYEYTAKHRGSISAEHGIGFLKTKSLKYSKNRDTIQLMSAIKNLLDPNGILNPYKVLS